MPDAIAQCKKSLLIFPATLSRRAKAPRYKGCACSAAVTSER